MNVEEVRRKIASEIAKTKAAIASYEEITKPVAPDVAIGRISRMDAIQNKSIAEAALGQARDKLNKLKFALANIDSPDFGICAKCKQPIPVGRILLKPESPYCVQCAD